MRNLFILGIAAIVCLGFISCSKSGAAADLQDAINLRTEVTLLAAQIKDLDQDVQSVVGPVLAKAKAEREAADTYFTDNKYPEAVEGFKKAADLYRKALSGHKVIEAGQKVYAARATLVDGWVPAEKISAVDRLLINVEGYIEAADVDGAVAELDKARAAYEKLAKAQVSTGIARLESAVAAKDQFLAEDVLAELEKLIPSDARMPGLRAKVAAVPGFKKKETVDLGNGVKIDLVLIRPGSFSMGSDKGDNDEKPVHRVTISKPFYIGAYEVTQAEWEAVMGSNPSEFKGSINPWRMFRGTTARNSSGG